MAFAMLPPGFARRGRGATHGAWGLGRWEEGLGSPPIPSFFQRGAAWSDWIGAPSHPVPLERPCGTRGAEESPKGRLIP